MDPTDSLSSVALRERLSSAGLLQAFTTAVRKSDRDALITMLDVVDDPTPELTATHVLRQPMFYGVEVERLPPELVGAGVLWILMASSALSASVLSLVMPQEDLSDLLSIFGYYPSIFRAQIPVALLAAVSVYFLFRRHRWARLALELLAWGVAAWGLVFTGLFYASLRGSVFGEAFGLMGGAAVLATGIGAAAYPALIIWLLRRDPVRRAVASVQQWHQPDSRDLH